MRAHTDTTHEHLHARWVQLNDEPVEDNPSLETYNLPERVDAFVQAAKQQVRPHKVNVAYLFITHAHTQHTQTSLCHAG